MDVLRVARLCAEGRTVREIADALGVSRSLVHKTLANRGAIGTAITALQLRTVSTIPSRAFYGQLTAGFEPVQRAKQCTEMWCGALKSVV